MARSGRPAVPTEQRFFSKVRKTDGCWEWTAFRDKDGYGFFWGGECYPSGKPITGRAHRWSYEHHVGPIPEGAQVMHSCDNPSCVNPEHLSVGTQADNSADMVAKGRSAIATNAHVKLSPDDIAAIRAEYRGWGNPSQRILAEKYGITQTQISKIVRGDSWRGHTLNSN